MQHYTADRFYAFILQNKVAVFVLHNLYLKEDASYNCSPENEGSIDSEWMQREEAIARNKIKQQKLSCAKWASDRKLKERNEGRMNIEQS